MAELRSSQTDPALTDLARRRDEHPAVRRLVDVVGAASAIGVALTLAWGGIGGYTPALGRIAACLAALLGASAAIVVYRMKRTLTKDAVVMFLLTLGLWVPVVLSMD
jgi:hypothetical protein